MLLTTRPGSPCGTAPQTKSRQPLVRFGSGAVLAIAALIAALSPKDEDLRGLKQQQLRLADQLIKEYFQNLQDCRPPAKPLPTVSGSISQNLSAINVVYSTDSNPGSLAGLLGSMASLCYHLSTPQVCVFHILARAQDMAVVRRTAECFQADDAHGRAKDQQHRSFSADARRHGKLDAGLQVHFRFHELDARMPEEGSFIRDDRRLDIAENTYFRFYIHRFLATEPRALVLCTDTIIQADVAPLYRMQMEHAVAAVPSRKTFRYFQRRWPRLHLLGDWVVDPDLPTFNAGVLMYDLDKWRAENFTEQLEALSPMTSMVNYDQTPLNVVFLHRFDHVDWRWHVENLGCFEVPQLCLDGAYILHWNGPDKPWLGGLYRHIFLSYMPRRVCGSARW